jgi:CRP-like cAMP-binding protein
MYLFGPTPRRAIEEMCAAASVAQWKLGEVVFEQGSPADYGMLVIDGRLVAVVESQGATREVGDIRSGELVGEQGIFAQGQQRNATVRAAETTVALILSRDLLHTGSLNPAVVAIEQHLLGTLARRIRRTNQAIQQSWKAEAPSPAAPAEAPAPTLRQRLWSLFGGGQ